MQQISAEALRQKLIDLSYWDKIHNGKLLEKVQRTTPANITPGGISQIISYWDEHLQYLCTIHRVVTKEGQIIHQDVKDAYIDGVRYWSV